MVRRDDLEKRVGDLERQFAVVTGGGRIPVRGIRKRASWGIGDFPIYDIALGPDFSRGEIRGHARGIVAIGDLATGVIALGGLSRGVVAIGGLAAGLITIGGLSVGVLVAAGGLVIGSLALGGVAVGGVAIGGGAVGYYACGGASTGVHASSGVHEDVEASEFFRRYGLAACAGRRTGPR